MKIYVITLSIFFSLYSFGMSATYDCKLQQFDTSSTIQIDSGSFTLVNYPENGGKLDLKASALAQAFLRPAMLANGEYGIGATIKFGLTDSVTAWTKIGSPIELATHGFYLICFVKQ